MTFAAMSYSYYGSRSDHMDVLNRYREYKVFWDRHRIPGQHYNEILWEDPWWKANNIHAKRRPRRLPPLKSPHKQEKSKEKRQVTFIAEKGKEKTPIVSIKKEEDVEETPQRTSTPKGEHQVVDVPTAEKENVKESKISPASSRASSAASKISEKKEDVKSLSRKSSSSSISSKSSSD